MNVILVSMVTDLYAQIKMNVTLMLTVAIPKQTVSILLEVEIVFVMLHIGREMELALKDVLTSMNVEVDLINVNLPMIIQILLNALIIMKDTLASARLDSNLMISYVLI